MYQESIHLSVLQKIIELYPTILPNYKTILQNHSISIFIKGYKNKHIINGAVSFNVEQELDIDIEVY